MFSAEVLVIVRRAISIKDGRSYELQIDRGFQVVVTFLFYPSPELPFMILGSMHGSAQKVRRPFGRK